MKALISPDEQRETGYRVADIHTTGFDIAQPLFWVDCDDAVVADQFWYDPQDQQIKAVPQPVQPEPLAQPTVDGAQQL